MKTCYTNNTVMAMTVGDFTINPIIVYNNVVSLVAESPDISIVIKSFEAYVTRPYYCMWLPESMFGEVMNALDQGTVYDESMFVALRFIKLLLTDLTRNIYDAVVYEEFIYDHRKGYPHGSIIYKEDNNLWAWCDTDRILINCKHQFIVPLDRPCDPTELPLIAARIMCNYLGIIYFHMTPNKAALRSCPQTALN